MIEDTYDAVIVGAGPAGTAAALMFTRFTDRRVLIVDHRVEPGLALGELVSPGVLPLLEFIGVGDSLSGDGHLPAEGVAASWTHPTPLPRDFFFSGRGHGWHLDRRRFNHSLARAAAARGASLAFETRVASVEPAEPNGPQWRLTLSSAGDTRAVLAKFLIDAGGRAAGLARRLGARPKATDALVGLAGFFDEFEREVDDNWPGTTLIEAIEDGWWYSAPLPGGRMVATLMTDAGIVADRGYNRAPAWQAGLQQAPLTASRVEGYRQPAAPIVRAAHSQVLEPACGSGWIAAGDAVAAFDPVSGLGIGHALSSGIHAARAAEAALRGDDSLLHQYAAGVSGNVLAYRQSLAATYASVGRFREAAFWSARQPGVEVL